MVERARIARDIHDTLAQAFVATSVQLECLDKARGERRPGHHARYTWNGPAMVKESLDEARRSVWVLRPQTLEHGLPAALETLGGGASGDTAGRAGGGGHAAPALAAGGGQPAAIAAGGGGRTPTATPAPGASSLRLSYASPRSVSLAVADDGTGLAGPGPRGPPIERGLAGMRERAADIGAEPGHREPGQRRDQHPGGAAGMSATPERSRIRVAVFDDHIMVREGIVALLGCTRSFEVVGEAGDGDSAIELYRRPQPDVALVDLRMPSKDGVAVIRELRKEFRICRLLVLTTYDSEDDISRALQAGASGYVLKGASRTTLTDAIRRCTPAAATSRRISPIACCPAPPTRS